MVAHRDGPPNAAVRWIHDHQSLENYSHMRRRIESFLIQLRYHISDMFVAQNIFL